MNDLEKVNKLKDLVVQNGGKFTAAELLTVTGTARRARRAVFVARKHGLILEPIRDNGRAVSAYMCVNALDLDIVVGQVAGSLKRKPKSAPGLPAPTENEEKTDGEDTAQEA